MKILITGGAGFIGSHVVDSYLDAGHEVVVVDNLSTGSIRNLNPKAKFYQMDICSHDLDTVFEMEKPDIVNHHAAQVSVPASIDDPLNDAEVNIKGFINVLQCSIKHNIKKVILISSGGAIYGEAKEYPTTEKYLPKPLSVYAINKLASEEYLRFYHHQYGLDYTILRYANVYGPRQSSQGEAGVVAIFTNTLLNGQPATINTYPGEPEGMIRDYVYVHDVVRANLAVLTKGRNDLFNIGTCVETTTSLLYKTILWQMGLDAKPLQGSARKGDLHRSMLDITKAFKELGWSPIYTLNDGIKETIAYYKEMKDR
jgi:UDP-glucose 4-epimerase